MKHILNENGQLVEITPEDLAAMSKEVREFHRDNLLVAWQTSKETLEKAKEREMELRVACVHLLGSDEKKSGTENVELGGGYVAKMVKKINYGWLKNADGKIDKKAIERALSKIEKDGAAGELIADRLVKWTPDLSLTEYNQLPEKYKKAIDEVIVTTESAPTLEIKEPKNK